MFRADRLAPLARLSLVATLALGGLSACHRKPEPPAQLTEQPATPALPEMDTAAASKPAAQLPFATGATPKPVATQVAPARQAPSELWKEFSGERAMAEVKRQVEVGPRPSGSTELGQARALITQGLKNAGWRVELQEFSDDTPRGPIKFVNIIARYGKAPPGEGTQAIVCSHYDTKRFSTIKFVGASDGASSTGALLELARVLALDPALASRVELVFFDGEEAVQQFTETDGLYGSRYYARVLSDSGRARSFKFGVLWDMIGDSDLTITLPTDSPQELVKGVFASAEMLGVRNNFSYFRGPVLDDHEPLIRQAKIPSIDLIDFDYRPWHTADDTIDKLSSQSLQTVGAVTVYFLRRTLPH